jgi:hypothetical protein
MLDITLLGYLSILGEVGPNADPGTVSQTSGDAGGWSYGLYQLASNPGVVQSFVVWLQQLPQPWKNYGDVLAAAGDPRWDASFVTAWQSIAMVDPGHFGQLQDEYAAERYFTPAAAILLDSYGLDIGQRSLPLKQVLFANAVQHGPRYGAVAFKEGADSVGKSLDDMADADIIKALYDNKITDPAWSSGSPACRPGLFARWGRERDTALELLG